MHAMCLGVVWVGWSWSAVAAAVGCYLLRMFAITAFYHRYFSHRAFKTSRWSQFVFAVLGTTAIQRGPLWWAAHHRHHHRSSDQLHDTHSPQHHGFLWSHMGWFTSRANFRTNLKAVRDFAKFPELCFLDRFDVVVAILFAASLYAIGVSLEVVAPQLETTGMQLLIWGFFISTVVLYHATYTINSLAHQIGRQRYDTGDRSGNSFFLALITLGEGWHNNHHHYPATARQGFYWWEIDLTYYLLRLLAWVGVIWDLKPLPPHMRNTRRLDLAEVA
jgi:stearoyl-CoA desaturase (delta-9 desaturase)